MIEDSEQTVDDDIRIVRLKTNAYTIPTDGPEADGTLEWHSTTLILTEIEAGGKSGIGYTYGDASIAAFIENNLKNQVIGKNALNIPFIWKQLVNSVRNNGNCGLAAMAISAVDTALWDLKAKIINLPLAELLGTVHKEVMLYGSGGFTSYPEKKLQEQLGGWAENGFTHVKMKIGRDVQEDRQRVQTARKSICGECSLMVDANGAYDVKTALQQADFFKDYGVSWFEEPVSSDNLNGLHFIREHAPAPIRITAGEYGYTLGYFAEMLKHQAVDVLQADATRCGGITGFLKAGYLCEAFKLPFSFHCAPALHLHAALSLPSFYIGEYFYDHVRIENMLFDGVQLPVNGKLKADLTRPGLGLEFKYGDAERYKVL